MGLAIMTPERDVMLVSDLDGMFYIQVVTGLKNSNREVKRQSKSLLKRRIT